MNGLVWHYTTGECFAAILDSGAIRPATAGVRAGERPAVWFSRREPWEPTANKMLLAPDRRLRSLSMRETAEYGGGLVRIGVARAVASHGWREFLTESGITPQMSRGLVKAAKEQKANPLDWFVCFSPVPRMMWSAVDVWDAGAWVRSWTAGQEAA